MKPVFEPTLVDYPYCVVQGRCECKKCRWARAFEAKLRSTVIENYWGNSTVIFKALREMLLGKRK